MLKKKHLNFLQILRGPRMYYSWFNRLGGEETIIKNIIKVSPIFGS